MPVLQIKRESLPTRCEICHQADCFDPLTDSCSRCAGVATSLATATPRMIAAQSATTPNQEELVVTRLMQARIILSWGVLACIFYHALQLYVFHTTKTSITGFGWILFWILRAGTEKVHRRDCMNFKPSKRNLSLFVSLTLAAAGTIAYCSIYELHNFWLTSSWVVLGVLFFLFVKSMIYTDIRAFFINRPNKPLTE